MRFSPIGVVLGTIAVFAAASTVNRKSMRGRMGISGVMIPVVLGSDPESEDLSGVDSILAL